MQIAQVTALIEGEAELAREGKEQVVAARLADGTGEAVRMQAALEVVPELALHVLRQPLARALVRVLEEASRCCSMTR